MKVRATTTTGYAPAYGPVANSYAPQYARNSGVRQIAQVMARPGNRRIRNVMRALNGVVAGAAANQSVARIASVMIRNGETGSGVRKIELVPINETTTTAQRDEINARIFDDINRTQPYAVDKSGNGGGGKRGY